MFEEQDGTEAHDNKNSLDEIAWRDACEKLKRWRLANHKTLDDVAKSIGMSGSWVKRLEKCETHLCMRKDRATMILAVSGVQFPLNHIARNSPYATSEMIAAILKEVDGRWLNSAEIATIIGHRRVVVSARLSALTRNGVLLSRKTSCPRNDGTTRLAMEWTLNKEAPQNHQASQDHQASGPSDIAYLEEQVEWYEQQIASVQDAISKKKTELRKAELQAKIAEQKALLDRLQEEAVALS